MNGLIIKNKKLIGKKQTYNLEMKSNFHNYIINGVVSKNSHSIGYSLMSYATAYYKVHYPVEYMCALLNSVTDDLEKLNLYIGECFRLGITLTPPDINTSGNEFVINDKNQIVFSLNAIKGLGKAVVNDIIRTRNTAPFVSFVDFINRTTKVDKGALQALLRVGAFNSLEKDCKRWDVLCDYLNEAKNSKYYQENGNIEKVIYTIVGTKNAKKSDKYLEYADLKRKLKNTVADKNKRVEYTEKQDKLIEMYIEHTAKHFLQFTTYKISERIQNEQDLIGFNISTNPYKRWNDFKKYYVQNNDGNIQYVELNELIDNGDKYASLPKLHTVGLLSEIKEIKTKKGDRMAKLTFEYYGNKTTITVFSQQWQGNIENKVQKGNFVSIVGRLVETNKQYTDEDYEIRLDTLRQLNVLVNENNKCIIDMKNKDTDKTINIIKRFVGSERQENIPIERVVLLKYDNNKFKALNGLAWIGNPDKLSHELI